MVFAPITPLFGVGSFALQVQDPKMQNNCVHLRLVHYTCHPQAHLLQFDFRL